MAMPRLRQSFLARPSLLPLPLPLPLSLSLSLSLFLSLSRALPSPFSLSPHPSLAHELSAAPLFFLPWIYQAKVQMALHQHSSSTMLDQTSFDTRRPSFAAPNLMM